MRIKNLFRKGALIFTFGVSFATQPAATNSTNANNEYLWFKVFAEAYLYTKEYYVKPVTTKKLMVNAIKGMVEKLDPYSEYFTPKEYKEFQEDLEGEFGGVGVEISIKDGRPVVVAPIEDTTRLPRRSQGGCTMVVAINGKDT